MELYRKSALERISSPEQLDKAMTVTSPLSWLALLAVTVMIVLAVVWSFVGTIPVTVTARGIVRDPTGANAIFMPREGTVVDYTNISIGSHVAPGTPVLFYRNGSKEETAVSDQIGTVEQLLVMNGNTVKIGAEIARITPDLAPYGDFYSTEQVVVCYVSLEDAKRLEMGKDVNVYLVGKQSSGYIRARVINVDSYVSTAAGLDYVLGEGNNLAASFQQNGAPVVAVTCALWKADPSHPTASGLLWSSTRGDKLEVANGTPVEAKIIVETVRPITKLFTQLNELWEGAA